MSEEIIYPPHVSALPINPWFDFRYNTVDPSSFVGRLLLVCHHSSLVSCILCLRVRFSWLNCLYSYLMHISVMLNSAGYFPAITLITSPEKVRYVQTILTGFGLYKRWPAYYSRNNQRSYSLRYIKHRFLQILPGKKLFSRVETAHKMLLIENSLLIWVKERVRKR